MPYFASKTMGCSGLIWCIVLNILLHSRLVYGFKCLGRDSPVITLPEGDINIPFGTPLEIYCIKETNFTGELRFHQGGSLLTRHVTKINETTSKLFIRNPDLQNSKKYYCQIGNSSNNCYNHVLVDTPPRLVTNFQCISDDLNSLECSWSIPNDTQSDLNYTISYTVDGSSQSVDFNANNRVSNTWSFVLDQSTTPIYRQQVSEYIFNLKSCNIFGCTHQNLAIDHFSIVKPMPPGNITVAKITPHTVLLQWNISPNMGDLLSCGLDHKIEYQIAKVDNRDFFHQAYPTNNSKPLISKSRTRYQYELDLPYAHMHYEVRIYIKSKKANGDSLWVFNHTIFQTESEIPHRPPEMPVGAFFPSLDQKLKPQIYIYWKQLEEFEECGSNFTYSIQVAQDGQVKVLKPNTTLSLSYVLLSNINADKAYNISVKSVNSVGESYNSSHLYIPPQAHRLVNSLKSFKKKGSENGTYELSWQLHSSLQIDNFTIFWCRYNVTKICKGRLDYTILPPNVNKYVINLPSDRKYQFAIAVNNNTETSGMMWAECDIPSAYNYVIDGQLLHEAPNDTSVPLKWDIPCMPSDTIKGYKITYCPIINTTEICDKTVPMGYEDILDGNKTSVVIKNLLYHRTYKFSLQIIREKESGGLLNTTGTTSVTTNAGVPTSPVNVAISHITHSSAIISFDPPVMKNGIITKYMFYKNNTKYEELSIDVTDNDNSRKVFPLYNLTGYTVYNWYVIACNNKACSKYNASNIISMRTSIGPPGKVRSLRPLNDEMKMLTWDPPADRGGFIDRYQVKKVKDGTVVYIRNTTETQISIDLCDGGIMYYVRAINLDNDPTHGAWANNTLSNITLWDESETSSEHLGEWCDYLYTYYCKNITEILLLAMFAVAIASGFALIKYKRYTKAAEDLSPKLPPGLQKIFEDECKKPQQDLRKPPPKNDKPSEEKLLLPSVKYGQPLVAKQKDENSAGSDRTDSTGVSETSREPFDKEASTSDETSVHSLDSDQGNVFQASNSIEKSPLVGKLHVKNPNTGYVDRVPEHNISYLPSERKDLSPDPCTEYVVASLEPAIHSAPKDVIIPVPRPSVSSGYVSHEAAKPNIRMNFPSLGPSPTKPETPRILPPILKTSESFQLQHLNANGKTAPWSPPMTKSKSSNGYVDHNSDIIKKHLNIMSGDLYDSDDPAIVDHSVMTDDAYSRISWNANPNTDNLNSIVLHANSAPIDSDN